MYAACSSATTGGLVLASKTSPRRMARPGRILNYKVRLTPAVRAKGVAKTKKGALTSGSGSSTILSLRVMLPTGVRYVKSSVSPPLLTTGAKHRRKVKRTATLDNSGLLLTWEDLRATPAPKGRTFKVTVRVDSYLVSGTALTFAAEVFETVSVGGTGIVACPRAAPNATSMVM